MKLLPYFKWYPGDAEGDDFYSLTLTNEELGIYHRLLNRAWMNDGITADLDVLAAFCRMSRDRFDEAWKKISKRWVVSPRDESKLVNPRQEEERAAAKLKSENNKRDGNANAKRTRSKRDAIDPQRAYESESTPPLEKEVIPFVQKPREPVKMDPLMLAFKDWIAPWKRCADEDSALRGWMSHITEDTMQAAFDCRDRYLESEEVSRGVVMEPWKFILQQAPKWSGKWPRARDHPSKKQSFEQQVTQQIEERLARGEKPW